jgi:polysaccharide pyruvyl transferase WcaK-like protein
MGQNPVSTMTRRTFLATSSALAARPTTPAPSGPSILLLSGWNIYNIGDVAITPGFLQLAQKHFPSARITLLAASYPKEITAYLTPKFPDLKVLPMEFHAGKSLSPAMEETFRGADLLVLNSGMTMSYGYYGLEWDRYIGRPLAFLKARELGIPYGVYAHSFDKLEPQADILYRDIFRTASFVYTRDSESLKVLKSAGVACPEMAFTPDSTFGFHWQNQERGESYLREHRLEPGKFLAFIPRLDVNRFRDDGHEKEHAEQTREIIVRWVRATGLPVALVPEVQKQIEPAKRMVYDLLPDDIRSAVRFQADFWMPDEAQYVYGKALALTSSEMHSIILGLAAGTPSVHFYFRQAGLKQWMVRDIGLPEWLLDQDQVSPEQIAQTLIAIAHDPAEARRKTVKAMAYVAERQTATMGVARRAAEKHYHRRSS